MLNFTIGPVMASEEILAIGGEQVPYFRTEEFSELMLQNEALIKEFVNAPLDARAVFITGSGTASMEATVMNVLNSDDKVLIVNGGTFGQRFVQLCEIYNIPHTAIFLSSGEVLTEEILQQYDNCGYSALLVNIHETSTGVRYNPDLLGDFCRRNKMLFIVDAISSFLADELDMVKQGIDVVIIGSQKVLACAPGISIITLSERAIKRVNSSYVRSLYFNLKDALKNGERGQTPFTPAVGILRQIHARLQQIKKNGGVSSEISKIKAQAEDFRKKIQGLPFEITSSSMSNAMTPIHPINVSAYDIFLQLKDNYGIWICPNGGELKDSIFRVGHFGAQTSEDNDTLIAAFHDLKMKGLL